MDLFYGFNLDEGFEDLWHELERIQDGNAGHHIAILGTEKKFAVQELLARLEPFFTERMYSSDENGNKVKT